MFKAYMYNEGGSAVEITKEEVEKKIGDLQSIFWIDISSEVEKYGDFFGDVMHIHPLAIEDMSHHRMMPKVEEYEGHLFIVLHDIVLQEKDNDERLKTHELFIAIGKNYIVTVRKHRVRAVESLHGELPVLTHLFSRGGVEAITHAIIRRMVDNYFPMLDRVEAKLDASEDAIFDTPSSADLQQIFTLRKDAIKLRSITTQQLDVINRIALGEFESISAHGLLLVRDLYDHLYRVSEKASGFREITMGLLDVYLSRASNKMNEVVKVLTMIATIILPLGIVVGFYGMNFKFLPGLRHPYGWLYTLLFMLSLSGGMLAYFRHKKWL